MCRVPSRPPIFQSQRPLSFPLGGDYRETGWRSNLSLSWEGLDGGRTDGWVGLADRKMLQADVINTWKLNWEYETYHILLHVF